MKTNEINYILNELNIVERLKRQLTSGAPLKIGCGDSMYLGNDQPSGKIVREGLIQVLEAYTEKLRQREKKEARQEINIVIEYCDKCMSCDKCAIREFCTEVRQFGTLFSDCPGYEVDKEGK
ncbi:hypothetical protein [Megasphaera massiliensis]|uniref:hypothetical protein n=1 Tax=Megasphaera massiliensis TaxID=1232428 RepID=UPI0005CB58D0|nr:hypothetical protein [Megasphaera massiliensis]DAF84498.1 MAG TPA: hypothetical protein [Caudoviricetes sp.]